MSLLNIFLIQCNMSNVHMRVSFVALHWCMVLFVYTKCICVQIIAHLNQNVCRFTSMLIYIKQKLCHSLKLLYFDTLKRKDTIRAHFKSNTVILNSKNSVSFRISEITCKNKKDRSRFIFSSYGILNTDTLLHILYKFCAIFA